MTANWVQWSGVILTFISLGITAYFLPNAQVSTTRLVLFQAVSGGIGWLIVAYPKIQELFVKSGGTAVQVKTWADKVEAKAHDVEVSAEEIRQINEDMQSTVRAIAESFAYIVGTNNIIPTPAAVAQVITDHVNKLAEFAYPDTAERNNAIAKWNATIAQAQGGV